MAVSSHLYGLVYDFCSSARNFAHWRHFQPPQSGFLQIPPHDGHPCLRLTVPTTKSVGDFHPQVVAHAGRTTKYPPPPKGEGGYIVFILPVCGIYTASPCLAAGLNPSPVRHVSTGNRGFNTVWTSRLHCIIMYAENACQRRRMRREQARSFCLMPATEIQLRILKQKGLGG